MIAGWDEEKAEFYHILVSLMGVLLRPSAVYVEFWLYWHFQAKNGLLVILLYATQAIKVYYFKRKPISYTFNRPV